MLPHDREDITKRRPRFVIPGRLCDRNGPIWMQCLSKERYQTVEAKKQRGCALNRQIGPLSLGLNPQLRTAFFKGAFQTPSLHKIHDNLLSCLPLIR